jgi:hypothetical protein
MHSTSSQTGDAKQQALELELVRQVVRRTYASAFSSTVIVDGLPKRRAVTNRDATLKDAV